MHEQFASYYDPGTSTLELRGTFDQDAWAHVPEELDRAFRRTACQLTVDLTRADGVPVDQVGRLVHLCSCNYPGTIVRAAAQRRAG
ncbi:hypothetical protein [Nocardioides sp.]|uniref:hypothetical protein n=1 Tax=Nocardioides sp. TaxID=35761 RepID=UPI00356AB0D4